MTSLNITPSFRRRPESINGKSISYTGTLDFPIKKRRQMHQPVAMQKAPCVYILASHRNGTLYTGVTSNLAQRTYLHRIGFSDGFSKKYGCKQLVYFEWYESMPKAIAREKQIKNWKRSWKLRLIHQFNPDWKDLYPEIIS